MHAVGALWLALIPLAATDGALDSPVGRKIQNFELHDHLGTPHALKDWADKRAVVVVFLGTECPLAKQYGGRLAELAERYQSKEVQIIGINSNQQDSLAEISHFVREQKI
ncbi:MAG TPA: redoxin domain-containing protein, partial [Pirellulaceae bacterium]|nr:redoxin domain-containing protein [Pirellulaceae bacterium]